MDYINTIYNTIPAPQRTGVTNNILPYYVDYNVTLFSRGHFLPLNNLFYTARFNGYCVHADGRETLIKQQYSSGKMSVNDITLRMIDQLNRQFQRNLPFGGQLLPGVPHIYPFLSGCDVDFMTKTYETANKPDVTDMSDNGYFPWCGFGEIIYHKEIY